MNDERRRSELNFQGLYIVQKKVNNIDTRPC